MNCTKCGVHAQIDNVCNETYLIEQLKNVFLCNHCILKTHSWITFKNELKRG